MEIATTGVYDLPEKAATDTFSIGAAVKRDAVNARIAALPSGPAIGKVIQPAAATDASARVRLDG